MAHADKQKKERVEQLQTFELKEAYELVRFSNLSPNRRAKIIRCKQYWDLYQDQTKAHMKKWTEEGKALGIAQGIEQGIAVGREEGRERLKNTAKRLIVIGLSDEQIQEVTELPHEEVRVLREATLRVVPDVV